MKTAEKNAKAVQGTGEKGNEVRTVNRPNITGKEAQEAQKDEPLKINHLPKLRKLRQTKLLRLRPFQPLPKLTNPQTLRNTGKK